MPDVTEAAKVPAKSPAQNGTWIQITFTLYPEHYHTLWERAGHEHRNIFSLVREGVTDYLKEMK